MRSLKILAFIVLISVSLMLTSCFQTTLATPEQLTVENNTLRWNSVNGASNYAIAVDGLEKAKTANTYYDLVSLGLEDGITYEIQVKAIGDGYFYLNSDFSEKVSVTYYLENEDDSNNDSNNDTNNGGDSVVNPPEGVNIPIQDTSDTFFYKAHPVSTPTLKDEFTDGVYNYYYYYLGYLENVPLVFSTIKYYGGNSVNMSFSETISYETQASIEVAVESSITETSGGSTSFEKGVELTIGNEGWVVSGKGHINVTDNWTWEKSTTSSTTHRVAESWANGTSRTISQSFDSSSKIGYYRYVQYTKRCDVFALVMYDLDTGKFTWNYLSYTENSMQHTIEMIEYSEDGTFDSDHESKLIFDQSVIDKINLNKNLTYKGPAIETPCYPITVSLNRHHCAHDTGYDTNTIGNSINATIDHSLFEMGHIVIYGCKQNGDIFTIAEPENFKIEYIFEQDPENLPATKSGDLRISDDSSSTVLNTNLGGNAIGKGAYEIVIKYKNGSTAKVVTTYDFMNGKSKDSVVDMLATSIYEVKLSNVAEIKITVVYELYFWASVFDHHHSDWRCDYTFNFE